MWYVPSTCLPAAAAAAEPSTEPSGAAANALPNCAAYAELRGSAVDPVRWERLALRLYLSYVQWATYADKRFPSHVLGAFVNLFCNVTLNRDTNFNHITVITNLMRLKKNLFFLIEFNMVLTVPLLFKAR